jgi:hypothetical protein
VRREPMTFLAPLALAACLAMAPWAVGGQPDPDPEALRFVHAQVERLGSDSWVERDQAQAQLAGDPRPLLSAIEHVLAAGSIGGRELTPEQRARLSGAGRERFFQEPRAAMGVSFQPVGTTGVRVTDTVEGFDSQRALHPGDVILAMQGLPVRSEFDFRLAIISQDPGARVTLRVLRQGEPTEVQLVLGRYDDLDTRARTPDATELAMAWERRLLQRGAGRSDPDAVEVDLPATARDVRGAFVADDQLFVQWRGDAIALGREVGDHRALAVRTVVAGGEPRGFSPSPGDDGHMFFRFGAGADEDQGGRRRGALQQLEQHEREAQLAAQRVQRLRAELRDAEAAIEAAEEPDARAQAEQRRELLLRQHQQAVEDLRRRTRVLELLIRDRE